MYNKKIPENLLQRQNLSNLEHDLEEDEITLLIGARQVGKTSLMFMLLNFLIKTTKIFPAQIFYFDLENIIETERLNKIKDFEEFIQLLKDEGANVKNKIWVFIDEIQYLDYPSRLLKYIHNHYKSRVKFVVSGSSTLEIKKKFSDRLTGRVHTFIIHTLNFYEYLSFQKQENLAEKKQGLNIWQLMDKDKFELLSWYKNLAHSFQRHFENFSIFGGYPGVVLKRDFIKWTQDLMGIYSLYVRKDIKDLASIGDTKGFNNLVTMLAHQIGSLVNESELSSSVGISRPTIKKYLSLLENTFVISLIRPFYTNARLEYCKMPKIFFNDQGLRNASINDFKILQRGDWGHLVENTIFSELYKTKPKFQELHFWRSERGTEVDFIIKDNKILPVEVKYRSFQEAKISPGLRSFIKKYSPEKSAVVTKDFWGELQFQGTKILFLPAWAV